MFLIYALRDPITKEIRYIGKAKDPEKRLQQHIKDSKYSKVKTHKENWVCSLIKLDKQPELLALEWVEDEVWEDKEIEWIAYGKSLGWPLTNISLGGKQHSEQSKQKLSTSHKNKSLSFTHRCNLAKLSPQDIESIRYKYYVDRIPQKQLAITFGVGQSQISRIVRGQAWELLPGSQTLDGRVLTDKSGESNPASKLCSEDVLCIRSLYAEGNLTQNTLAKMFNVGQSTVTSIVTRKTWKHI